MMAKRAVNGLALLGSLPGLLLAAAVDAREPAVAAADLVLAQYVGVARVPGGDGAAVALSVDDGTTVVPIFIGLVEAAAIVRAERGLRPPRPMTHELLTDLMTASGGALVQVVIDDLREGVYYATVQLRVHGTRLVWVDARPSDALALALRHTVPIRLGPAVVASAPDPDGAAVGAETLTGLRL
jgi:bifunctional DNase/RNase